jgi:hypothetical protein
VDEVDAEHDAWIRELYVQFVAVKRDALPSGLLPGRS